MKKLFLVLIITFFITTKFACAAGFTIVNPYKGTDGTGPYGNWYGIVSHTHGPATGSNGTLTQLFSDALALGVIVVPIDDKDVVTPDPGSHPGQYYLPGYEEVSSPGPHVLCIEGCSTWAPRTSLQEAFDYGHNQGGIMVLPHPSFTGVKWSDIASINNIDGIEVDNGQGYYGFDVWDSGLFAGRKLIGTAGNDEYVRGYAEVMFVNSPTNSISDILANFKLGNFYGSSANMIGGPLRAMRIIQSGDTLTAIVWNSETDHTPYNTTINWLCGYPSAGSVCGTGANYTITGVEKYVRAEVWSGNNYQPRTWSQPIYIVQNSLFPLPSAIGAH
jgi:hypothetical protein